MIDQPMRVLVAESEPDQREILARVAAVALDAEVVAVSDGGEALGELEAASYEFDLVLLGVEMARASGLDVLSAVHSIRPEVPVVLFSRDAAASEAALELGARAFVRRPFRPAELGARLPDLVPARRQALAPVG